MQLHLILLAQLHEELQYLLKLLLTLIFFCNADLIFAFVH
jgi:hypothetical protein